MISNMESCTPSRASAVSTSGLRGLAMRASDPQPPLRASHHGPSLRRQGPQQVAVCSSDKRVPAEIQPARRVLLGSLMATVLQGSATPKAEAAGRDLVKGFLRPKAVSPEDALVQLLDARGTALELQILANTPMDSQERFEARSILPGMATALRKVQDAAPSALSLIQADVEASLGGRYGGDAAAGEKGVLDDVYVSVGRVLTLSGRTIRAEAIEQGSKLTSQAASSLDSLVALLPKEAVDKAQERRRARLSN
mmetsp:Transcript_8152/g.23404  ORF Transcript_8152/g.23404 Transcript_8152/m.23404 type:complete len:253 (+) Transcript_8152:68-826(+)